MIFMLYTFHFWAHPKNHTCAQKKHAIPPPFPPLRTLETRGALLIHIYIYLYLSSISYHLCLIIIPFLYMIFFILSLLLLILPF